MWFFTLKNHKKVIINFSLFLADFSDLKIWKILKKDFSESKLFKSLGWSATAVDSFCDFWSPGGRRSQKWAGPAIFGEPQVRSRASAAIFASKPTKCALAYARARVELLRSSTLLGNIPKAIFIFFFCGRQDFRFFGHFGQKNGSKGLWGKSLAKRLRLFETDGFGVASAGVENRQSVSEILDRSGIFVSKTTVILLTSRGYIVGSLYSDWSRPQVRGNGFYLALAGDFVTKIAILRFSRKKFFALYEKIFVVCKGDFFVFAFLCETVVKIFRDFWKIAKNSWNPNTLDENRKNFAIFRICENHFLWFSQRLGEFL